jgi:DMSO/TMAO reductase YedYZ molybdopterin-dependent catalytic subunit
VIQAARRLPWNRFFAGALAGVAGLALTLLLRLLGLGVFLPELAVDFAVAVIPGQVESFFIQAMGGGAKVLAVLTAVFVFLALLGVLATLYRRLEARLRNRWLVIAANTAIVTAVTLLAVIPVLGGGVAGTQTAAGPAAAVFSQLLGAWLYASVLDYFLVEVANRHPEGFSLTRRQFLAAGLLALGSLALAAYGLGSLVTRPGRLAFASIAELFAKEVTPNAEHYTVTKNLVDPDVDAGAWRLSVDGLAANPLTRSYEELTASAASDEYVTLECVSNQVGGNLIGTAKWTGLRLRDLLDAAGPDPSADWVEFASADGYAVAVPMTRARHPQALLALRMNDSPLPRAHGFPARIIVPGLYGMFHAKWVTRVSLRRGETLGFWQQKGWTNGGAVRTAAIIATPPEDQVITGPVTLGGVAFAGDRGVSAVQVSRDGGETWEAATLKSPPLSGATWVLWSFPWSPPASGAHRFLVRAVDGAGTTQEATRSPPFPEGASGYDEVTLLVSL